MNTDNGKLINPKEFNSLMDLQKENYIQVDDKDMTKKQKSEMQVSLKDHNSKLGKKLTRIRQAKKVGRNSTCPCGSGLKYKNCHCER